MIYGRKQSEKPWNKKAIYGGVGAATWMSVSIYFLT